MYASRMTVPFVAPAHRGTSPSNWLAQNQFGSETNIRSLHESACLTREYLSARHRVALAIIPGIPLNE